MRYLWFVSLVAACGGLLFGYDAVVVSGTNSQVVTQFGFTPSQLGFYVSCVLWGCAIGSGIAGFVADSLGRKKTLMTAAIMIFISATWSGLASSVPSLIFARLLGGLGIGAATMVCPLYISEISPEKYRGRMVTLFQLTITIGIIFCVFSNWGIFTYSSNNVDNSALPKLIKWMAVDENWRLMFFAEAMPGLIFLSAAFFIPESPRWLIKNNITNEALTILKRVNPIEKAKHITAEIEDAVFQESSISFWDLFTNKLKRPLIIAVLICFFSEACGVSVIFYYGPQIFEDSGFGLGGSLGGFATIAIVNFIATLFALKYVDSMGRKKLLTIGIIGSMFAQLLLASLFFLDIKGWPIVLAINIFVAFFACAIGPIKFIIISEIFPNKIRGKAISLATVTIWISSAGVAQLFPIMRDSWPTGFIFLIFGGILIIFLPVVRYLLPETKGKTIEEIEKSWLH